MSNHNALGTAVTIDGYPKENSGAPELRRPDERRRAYPDVFGYIICAIDLIGLWRERARGRRQLAMMPDHLLKDVGVTSVEAEREISKPFWRG